MFKTIETTIIAKTDKFDKAFDKFDKAFDDMSEGLQEFSKSLSDMEVEKTASIEIYGDTKQKALDELNKLSVYGYKLDSIEEDKSKGVWILRANK